MEGAAWGRGARIEDLSAEELEELWDAAKGMEKVGGMTPSELAELEQRMDAEGQEARRG